VGSGVSLFGVYPLPPGLFADTETLTFVLASLMNVGERILHENVHFLGKQVKK
jgi:hypothetical protein